MIRIEIANYQTEKDIIHRIRYEVFVQEQHVPAELEIDRWDPLSVHVLAHYGEQAIGTGRLLPNGYIGRVAVCRLMRYRGIGRLVMERLLQAAQDQGHQKVTLSAQCHAVDFYQKLGFWAEGKVYQEAGIDHIKMVKPLAQPASAIASASQKVQPLENCSAQRRNRILAATYKGA
ncbi:MAG TPA: GNAT family N-acetyltransferase [Trichocoleus sp.]